jgi:hypothetical protein
MNTNKTKQLKRFFAGAAGLLVTALSLSADPLLTLIPGSLSGPPGPTLGWGFTIANDSGYIEITSSQFCENPVNFPLVCSSPTTGTYNDIISSPPNDVIVGPPGGTEADSVSQSFDPVALMGVGSFVINGGASVGASDAGEIVLTYNLSDLDPNDPNYDPSVDLLATDLQLTANTNITVSGPAGPPGLPEPGTAWLAFGVLGVCLALRLRYMRFSLSPAAAIVSYFLQKQKRICVEPRSGLR